MEVLRPLNITLRLSTIVNCYVFAFAFPKCNRFLQAFVLRELERSRKWVERSLYTLKLKALGHGTSPRA